YYSPEQFFSFTPWERLRVFQMGYFREARRMLEEGKTPDAFRQLITEKSKSEQVNRLGFEPENNGTLQCERVHFSSKHSKMPWYKNIETQGAKWRLFIAG